MIENSQHSNSENNMNIGIVQFSESRKTRKNTNVVVVLRIRYLITRFKDIYIVVTKVDKKSL